MSFQASVVSLIEITRQAIEPGSEHLLGVCALWDIK